MEIIQGDPGDEHMEINQDGIQVNYDQSLDFNKSDYELHGINLSASMNKLSSDNQLISFAVDNISLSDDMDEAEGLEVVRVTSDQYANGDIECPYTGSKEIYRVSEGRFASFDTDQEFIVEIVD